MTTCSSVLAQESPCTEEPGGLESTGSQSQTRLNEVTRRSKRACMSGSGSVNVSSLLQLFSSL